MAVFYDTGGGDTYAGPDRDSVIAAMKADLGTVGGACEAISVSAT